MVNYNISIGNHNRDKLISYITMKKKEGKFTIIDVGGSLGGWSTPYVDAIVDFNEPVNQYQHITHFKCDITHPDSWNDIIKYCNENGKFDFCICTHTLEDIMNPSYVCEQIAKISSNGYIAVPSKYRELSRFEHSSGYRGYIHHRWIFDIIDNVFVGYPKINYIDNTKIFDTISDMNEDKSDLSFYWKDYIDIKYTNNNYLGPSVEHVISYYNDLLM
jgi:hypothetical protein